MELRLFGSQIIVRKHGTKTAWKSNNRKKPNNPRGNEAITDREHHQGLSMVASVLKFFYSFFLPRA